MRAENAIAAHHKRAWPTKVQRLVGSEFEPWLAHTPEATLVLFDAPWSAASRLEIEVLSHLAEHFAGRVHAGVLDASASTEVSGHFRIGWVPTLILFEAGREVARWVGARRLADLVVDIDSALTRGNATRLVPEHAPVADPRDTLEVDPLSNRKHGGSS